MNSIINVNPFLASPVQLPETNRRLLRLIRLSSALPSELGEFANRKELCDRLVEICSKMHDLAAKNLAQATECWREEEKNLSPGLKGYLAPLFYKAGKKVDWLQNLSAYVMSDVKTVTSLLPVRKSFRGFNGPTLLMRYPIYSKEQEITAFHKAVIKWIDGLEWKMHHVYKLFSDTAFKEVFSVPKAITIKGAKHIGIEGDVQTIASETAQALEETFSEIRKTTVGNEPVSFEDPAIFLMDRIEGENLFDFILTKYSKLKREQKEALFERLGQLSLLDLVLGHDDRLVCAMYYEKDQSIQFDDLEGNLGNVMISLEEEGDLPSVVAIDNEIAKRYVLEGVERKAYKKFLEEFAQSGSPGPTLAENVIGTMRSALRNGLDDIEGDHKNARVAFALFQKDLSEIAKEPLKKGVEKAMQSLAGSDAIDWSKLRAADAINEELLSSLQERLAIFQQQTQRSVI